MRLTFTQKEKFEELFSTIDILFNNIDFGLMYSEIEEAWVIGDTLRELLLFSNPPITEYSFYLQTKDATSIYPWLSRLAEKNVPFEVVEKQFHFDQEQVFQQIIISLHQFDVSYEIQIITGILDVKPFLIQHFPIATSLLALDIGELIFLLSKNSSVETISKKIWMDSRCKKDIKNKTITVLKQPWMKNSTNYPFMEAYLEKTYQKLYNLGFK